MTTTSGDTTTASAQRRRLGLVPPDERDRLRAGLGGLLRQYREAAGLSARGLAGQAGVSASTVTRLERGERRPRGGLLLMLAAVLNPTDPNTLAAELRQAAGESLCPDTDRSLARSGQFLALMARRMAGPRRCPTCGQRCRP